MPELKLDYILIIDEKLLKNKAKKFNFFAKLQASPFTFLEPLLNIPKNSETSENSENLPKLFDKVFLSHNAKNTKITNQAIENWLRKHSNIEQANLNILQLLRQLDQVQPPNFAVYVIFTKKTQAEQLKREIKNLSRLAPASIVIFTNMDKPAAYYRTVLHYTLIKKLMAWIMELAKDVMTYPNLKQDNLNLLITPLLQNLNADQSLIVGPAKQPSELLSNINHYYNLIVLLAIYLDSCSLANSSEVTRTYKNKFEAMLNQLKSKEDIALKRLLSKQNTPNNSSNALSITDSIKENFVELLTTLAQEKLGPTLFTTQANFCVTKTLFETEGLLPPAVLAIFSASLATSRPRSNAIYENIYVM